MRKLTVIKTEQQNILQVESNKKRGVICKKAKSKIPAKQGI